jgi:hypothetical protein
MYTRFLSRPHPAARGDGMRNSYKGFKTMKVTPKQIGRAIVNSRRIIRSNNPPWLKKLAHVVLALSATKG